MLGPNVITIKIIFDYFILWFFDMLLFPSCFIILLKFFSYANAEMFGKVPNKINITPKYLQNSLKQVNTFLADVESRIKNERRVLSSNIDLYNLKMTENGGEFLQYGNTDIWWTGTEDPVTQNNEEKTDNVKRVGEGINKTMERGSSVGLTREYETSIEENHNEGNAYYDDNQKQSITSLPYNLIKSNQYYSNNNKDLEINTNITEINDSKIINQIKNKQEDNTQNIDTLTTDNSIEELEYTLTTKFATHMENKTKELINNDLLIKMAGRIQNSSSRNKISSPYYNPNSEHFNTSAFATNVSPIIARNQTEPVLNLDYDIYWTTQSIVDFLKPEDNAEEVDNQDLNLGPVASPVTAVATSAITNTEVVEAPLPEMTTEFQEEFQAVPDYHETASPVTPEFVEDLIMGLETTTAVTLNPFGTNLKKSMETLKMGYFSIFLVKMFEIIAMKRPSSGLIPLFRELESQVTLLVNHGQLIALGQLLTSNMMNLIQLLNAAPSDVIQSQATAAHHMLQRRRFFLGRDVNAILDYVDNTFNDDDEPKVFNVLEELYDFPRGNKTAKELVHVALEDVLLVPYRRLAGSVKRQILIDSINLALQSRMIDAAFIQRRQNRNKHFKSLLDANKKDNFKRKSTKDFNVEDRNAEMNERNIVLRSKKLTNQQKKKHNYKIFSKLNIGAGEEVALQTLNNKNNYKHTHKTKKKDKINRTKKKTVHLVTKHQKIYKKYINNHSRKKYKKNNLNSKRFENSKRKAFYDEHKYEKFLRNRVSEKRDINIKSTEEKYESDTVNEIQEFIDRPKLIKKRFNIVTRLKKNKEYYKPITSFRTKLPNVKITTVENYKQKNSVSILQKSKYLNPDFSYIKTFETNFNNTKKSILDRITELSSYSDEGMYLQANLDDAVKYDGRKYAVNGRKTNTNVINNVFSRISSDSDEEWVFKSNIYKALTVPVDVQDNKNK